VRTTHTPWCAWPSTDNPSILSSTAHTAPDPPRVRSPSIFPAPQKLILPAHPFNRRPLEHHSKPIIPASAANTGGFLQVAVSKAPGRKSHSASCSYQPGASDTALRLRDKNAANGACRVYHSLCRSGGAKDRSRQLLHAQLATGLPLTPEEQGLALGWLSDLAVFPCRCRKSKLSPRVMHASRSLLCMRREDVQFLGAGRQPRITIARAAVTTVPSPTELRGMGRGKGLLESSR